MHGPLRRPESLTENYGRLKRREMRPVRIQHFEKARGVEMDHNWGGFRSEWTSLYRVVVAYLFMVFGYYLSVSSAS